MRIEKSTDPMHVDLEIPESSEDQVSLMEQHLSGDSGVPPEYVHQMCEILMKFAWNDALDLAKNRLEEEIALYPKSMKGCDPDERAMLNAERTGMKIAVNRLKQLRK